MPTDLGEEQDPCFEESTTCSKIMAVGTLMATIFSKVFFILLFLSKGKNEVFAFVLDVVVVVYSVYHMPRYIPQSNFFNPVYELCYKKLSKARNPPPPPPAPPSLLYMPITVTFTSFHDIKRPCRSTPPRLGPSPASRSSLSASQVQTTEETRPDRTERSPSPRTAPDPMPHRLPSPIPEQATPTSSASASLSLCSSAPYLAGKACPCCPG
jgi:hypothetical protein